MKTSKFSKNILMVSLIGITLFTFAFHIRYSQRNIKMDDLMRIEAVAPSVASQNIVRTLRKAVVYDLNYLNQIIFYSSHKGKIVYPIGKFRIWDGFMAVLAVLMIYRVGCMCGSKFTGFLSAIIMALIPPSLWGDHASRIFIVLLNFELLITAISKDTISRWVFWSLSTVLLFSTGVFAEALLLQSWFLAVLIILILWSVGTKVLPEWKKFINLAHDARRKKRKSLWKKIQGDTGFSRYIAAAIFVGVIVMALSITGGLFISSSILSVEGLAAVILLAFGMTFITSIILIALPIFHRERNIILDWLVDYKAGKTTRLPYEVFTTLKSGVILRVIFSYSAAALFFLPFFFVIYKGINIFIDTWQVGKLSAFINDSSNIIYGWFFLALPAVFLLITIICYIFRGVSRGRLIGAVSLLIMSSIYIIQQRYAVISTPFYIICVAGILATIVEMFSHLFVKQDSKYKNA